MVRRVLGRIDEWFLADEPNAAGRMGWYRILFALFYLWHVAAFDLSLIAGLPAHEQTFLPINALLPSMPSGGLLAGLDRALVVALVLLGFGWKVRLTTVAVLILGIAREGYLAPLNVEDANAFLAFQIPLFMALAGRWGDTLSIDALARRDRGEPTVRRSTSSGAHFIAARAVLVMLAVLFTTSPLFKLLRGGTWLHFPDVVANLMLHRSVEATLRGFGANPLAAWIAPHPALGAVLTASVLLFEALFFLVLFNRRFRDFYLALAMVFHAVNAIWTLVSFTGILAAYALFVDWERLLGRFVSERTDRRRLSAAAATAVAFASALIIAITWQASGRLLTGWGMLDWRTIWIPLLPISLFLTARNAFRLLSPPGRPARVTRQATEGAPTDAAT